MLKPRLIQSPNFQALPAKDFGFGYMGETDEDELETAGNLSSNRTRYSTTYVKLKFKGSYMEIVFIT